MHGVWTGLPETGVTYPLDVSLHGDVARITLDACGEALNRRGYRTWNGEAPLRETLAAALLEISPWRPGLALHDPCCGTGTLLIEAAFKQARRAPGLFRPFAMEQFSIFSQEEADTLRAEAKAQYDPERIHDLSGSDIAAEPLTLAKRHIVQAQLGGRIMVTQQPLETLQLTGAPGVFIANPPYGERLSDRKTCEKLYAELHRLKDRHPGWSLCAISSHPGFERLLRPQSRQSSSSLQRSPRMQFLYLSVRYSGGGQPFCERPLPRTPSRKGYKAKARGGEAASTERSASPPDPLSRRAAGV